MAVKDHLDAAAAVVPCTDAEGFLRNAVRGSGGLRWGPKFWVGFRSAR